MNETDSKVFSLKNLHLIISVFLILIIGLVYGVDPINILPKLLGFAVDNINSKNVFRALMGLHIAMSSIWILGIFNKKLWVIATTSNVTFMSGLAMGRAISLILDGVPGIYFELGLVAEMILAFWGNLNLFNYTKKVC